MDHRNAKSNPTPSVAHESNKNEVDRPDTGVQSIVTTMTVCPKPYTGMINPEKIKAMK